MGRADIAVWRVALAAWPRRAWALGVLVALAGCPSPAVQRPDPRTPAGASRPDGAATTHVVQPGETLWRISRQYDVPVEEIARANGLDDPAKLAPGRTIVIPRPAAGPAKPAPAPQPSAQSLPRSTTPTASKIAFEWPLLGVLYARYGPRGETRHDGIDIAAPVGTPVRAAAEGLVLYAGEQRGYGHVVILQHDEGLMTLYAHNRETLVRDGARVKVGDPIAKVGPGSKSSGPHLHFEVRDGKLPRDPLKYLPAPR